MFTSAAHLDSSSTELKSEHADGLKQFKSALEGLIEERLGAFTPFEQDQRRYGATRFATIGAAFLIVVSVLVLYAGPFLIHEIKKEASQLALRMNETLPELKKGLAVTESNVAALVKEGNLGLEYALMLRKQALSRCAVLNMPSQIYRRPASTLVDSQAKIERVVIDGLLLEAQRILSLLPPTTENNSQKLKTEIWSAMLFNGLDSMAGDGFERHKQIEELKKRGLPIIGKGGCQRRSNFPSASRSNNPSVVDV